MKLKITKKHKYALQALIISGLLYYFSQNISEDGAKEIIVLSVLTMASSFFVHQPNSKLLNILVTSILPVSLIAGVTLSLVFFPNLSITFKTFSVVGFAVLFYVIALANNVFLVVETRKEIIPLYRVALTWSKILIVVVAIPLLAGVYKMSFNPLLETAVTSFIALLFYLYLIWILKYSHEAKKYKVGEIVAILAFGVFITGASNISVSFFPTETFLRALFISSVLIFSISYIEAHLKNVVKKRLITEHLIISLAFLFLLVVFTP